MYANEPVLIPDVPGKISFKKKKGSEYVQYETDRKYNPDRKYNLPDRKIIGIRIPAIPEMMLPNENYRKYFSEGEEKMSNSQKEPRRNMLRTKNSLRSCATCLTSCIMNFRCSPEGSRTRH